MPGPYKWLMTVNRHQHLSSRLIPSLYFLSQFMVPLSTQAPSQKPATPPGFVCLPYHVSIITHLQSMPSSIQMPHSHEYPAQAFIISSSWFPAPILGSFSPKPHCSDLKYESPRHFHALSHNLSSPSHTHTPASLPYLPTLPISLFMLWHHYQLPGFSLHPDSTPLFTWFSCLWHLWLSLLANSFERLLQSLPWIPGGMHTPLPCFGNVQGLSLTTSY